MSENTPDDSNITFCVDLTINEAAVLKTLVEFHSDDPDDAYYSSKDFESLKKKIENLP